MQVQAVKLEQGWFIEDLPSFEEIKSDVIDINVDLAPNQLNGLDYKELRGIAIMERYFEKREREIREIKNITDLKEKFLGRFGILPNRFIESIEEL